MTTSSTHTPSERQLAALSSSALRRSSALGALAAGAVVVGLAATTASADTTPWTVTDLRPVGEQPAAGRVASPWTVGGAAPTSTRPATVPVTSRASTTRRRPVRHAAWRRTWRPWSTWRAATACRPTTDGRWTVRPGDTLSLVASCGRSTVVEVAAASGIDAASTLRVGQVLTVPAVTR